MDFLKNNPLPRFESIIQEISKQIFQTQNLTKTELLGVGIRDLQIILEKNLERRITPITLSQRARGRPRKS